MAAPNPFKRRGATPLLWAIGLLFLFSEAGRTEGPQVVPSYDSLKHLSLQELGNIEVTSASKEPEALKRTPAAIHVLTNEDIRRSGATSLPEVLRLVPGIQVARMDSGHWAVGVRGFANQFSQSLLVLVDGRSVYTPLFAGVFWSVQDTLLEDIERIEVIRGPGGTIWGANAVNGVINIITKNARDTQGSLASVGVGTQDRAVAGIRYGGAKGKEFDYRVYAKGFDRAPEFHSDGHEYDDWRMAQGGFRADWTRKRDIVTVQGDLYKGRDGQSVSIASFSPPAQAISYAPLNVSGSNVLARWRRGMEGGSDLQLQTYYDRTYLLGPQVGESRHTFDVDFIHHLTNVPRHNFIWGAGVRLSPSEITQTVPTVDFVPHERTDSIYGVFAQDEIAIVKKRLWLTLGSKIERNTYTGVEMQPSARLLWSPSDTQSIWTAVTRAVRTPSRIEEEFQLTAFLAPTPPTFLRVMGNPDFLPERLRGYEAGYRRELTPQFYVDVSVFHNEHDDLQSFGAFSTMVETTPAPPHLLLVLPYANGVRGTSNGFEISPDWKPARAWQTKVAYSYLNINLTNKPGNTDTSAVTRYEGSSPRHQLLVRSLFTLTRSVQFDQTLRYASALPAQAVDAYATADLRLGWQLNRTLAVSVVGRNLAQAHHFEFGHAPPPAVALTRNVSATLTWIR